MNSDSNIFNCPARRKKRGSFSTTKHEPQMNADKHRFNASVSMETVVIQHPFTQAARVPRADRAFLIYKDESTIDSA
jgi:hypothetical protein